MLRKSLIGMAAAATLALSMPALSTDASAHGWHHHHHHYWHGCHCWGHHHYWHRWYWGRTWGWGPWPWGWGGVGW